MDWNLNAENILPENDDRFDAQALADALKDDRSRQFAELYATTPRWLDDVA